ncbi:cupin domain-containing protein [Xanthomonas sp. A2111]|nr:MULTISPECIES: cupin domain-containing protein [unclassified Xanthomonas]MBO9830127.1 cupin domain-containing protein [Xanthomonas sp. A2111]MBO9873628.1 cupin domain-containing protein [Xanthomonas sp. D-93]WNH44144.1 cupin domain-containing protein [Xanthomonas sp. A6251]
MTDAHPMAGSLLAALPDARGGEIFTELLRRSGCRVERIVSHGQTTPQDTPYLQAHDEWVLLLRGSARVALGEREVALAPGDHLFIPADTPHWVTFTDPEQPTVWLAIHLGEADVVV